MTTTHWRTRKARWLGPSGTLSTLYSHDFIRRALAVVYRGSESELWTADVYRELAPAYRETRGFWRRCDAKRWAVLAVMDWGLPEYCLAWRLDIAKAMVRDGRKVLRHRGYRALRRLSVPTS